MAETDLAPEDDWFYEPPEMPVETVQPAYTERRSGSIMPYFLTGLLVLNGIALFKGKSSEGTMRQGVSARLERAVAPNARLIGSQVLDAWNNGQAKITSRDATEGVVLELQSYTPNSFVTVDVTMFENVKNILDPTTVNDVEITEWDCGPKYCGGNAHVEQDTELIYGDGSTFTEGAWGAQTSSKPAGYEAAAMAVDTHLAKINESPGSEDAKQTFERAKVFADYAEVVVQEALTGQIVIPKG